MYSNTLKRTVGARNFFGPEEWATLFGIEIPTKDIPSVPWIEKLLRSPGLDQNHFLFLGLPHLFGNPITMQLMYDHFSGNDHPRLSYNGKWSLGFPYANKIVEPRWYFMTVGPLHGSEGLGFDDQKRMLPPAYEVPTLSARVFANILYRKLGPEYLDMGEVRTADTDPTQDEVVAVSADAKWGIDVILTAHTYAPTFMGKPNQQQVGLSASLIPTL